MNRHIVAIAAMGWSGVVDEAAELLWARCGRIGTAEEEEGWRRAADGEADGRHVVWWGCIYLRVIDVLWGNCLHSRYLFTMYACVGEVGGGSDVFSV